MKIRLIKGLSYKYGNIVATKNNPEIKVAEDVGKYLLGTGRFAFVNNESVEVDNGKATTYILKKKDLAERTKEELISYAKRLDIDVPATAKKNEIIDLILNEPKVDLEDGEPDTDTGFAHIEE